MAAFVALVLAAAANVADVPQRPPSTAATSANATVIILRAERVSASPETGTASHSVGRSVRYKDGKIAVDFY